MAAARDQQVGGEHYRSKLIQPWDAMSAWMSQEAFEGFLQGNVIKYIARYKDKNGREDLLKAQHYLARLLEVVPEKLPPPAPQPGVSEEERVAELKRLARALAMGKDTEPKDNPEPSPGVSEATSIMNARKEWGPWVDWRGDFSYPVWVDAVVEVRTVNKGRWVAPAGMLRWNHIRDGNDIIQYRVRTPSPNTQGVA